MLVLRCRIPQISNFFASGFYYKPELTLYYQIEKHRRTKDASNVQIKEELFSAAQLNSYVSTNGVYNLSTGIWQMVFVPAGSEALLSLVVKIKAGGNWLNKVELIGDPITQTPPFVCVSAIILICPERNESLTLTAPIELVSYQWFRNGQPIPGATSETYITSEAGRYLVRSGVSSECPQNECCPSSSDCRSL